MRSFPVLRRLAAVVMVVALAPFGLLADCAGWSSLAAERMACCQRDAAHCASVSPDDCCSDEEQRQNVEKPARIAALGITQLSTSVAVIPTAAPRTVDPSLSAAGPAPYLLASVFRI